eukprot:scaffold5202_cov110-Isochrysis_galbana.AAC.7
MKLIIAWGGGSLCRAEGRQRQRGCGWLGVCGRWRGEGVHERERVFECLDLVCCVDSHTTAESARARIA